METGVLPAGAFFRPIHNKWLQGVRRFVSYVHVNDVHFVCHGQRLPPPHQVGDCVMQAQKKHVSNPKSRHAHLAVKPVLAVLTPPLRAAGTL